MKKTYIIAVSGGVDSMVLLHKLSHIKPPNIVYIVAHINHGIREESDDDEQFVRRFAASYGHEFVSTQLHLNEKASEESARDGRYAFLYTQMKIHKAEGIITAHHQDDIIETMILNLLRGTGYRGLVGFTRANIIRPFVNMTKVEILNYASKHQLEWREDKTNIDTKYLRNYVRLHMMSKVKDTDEWLEIRRKVAESTREIDDLLKKMLVQTLEKGQLVRSLFVILPYIVQKELVAYWFRLSGVRFDRRTVEQATRACKVYAPGKTFVINDTAALECRKTTIVLKST